MKHIADKLEIFVLVGAVALSGCVGTKAGAFRVFAEDLERLKGKPISEAYVYNIGHLATLKPDSIKPLTNGNEIWVYAVKQPRREKCTVLVEVDVKNKFVVDASSKGPECLRAY